MLGVEVADARVPSGDPDAELVTSRAENGSARLHLRFPEARRVRDGANVVITINDDVALTFGYMEPGVEYDEVALGSRLYADEADLLADAVNDALGSKN